jgi:hypothetical protein
MALVLTTASTVSCDHAPGGPLGLEAAAASVLTVGGVSVLAGSLGSATIDPGCSQPVSNTTAPCAAATSQIGGTSQVLTVAGTPVLLADASGTTDSKPPGTWSVKDAAQSVLKAD